jgi:peptidoglycan/xylan/chitin deacetylase (PgdA/CDA1 family)
LGPVGGDSAWLSLTFDNLGEAAELEAGTFVGEPGQHFTAVAVVPEILAMLAERELPATFFVEGINVDFYPDLMEDIAARGHEVGYHAWRHEHWGTLMASEQSENLAYGMLCFETLGLEIAGMRPPGGSLGAGGYDLPSEAGLRYCSPAGAGAGEEQGVAILPFQWRHVDAACTLPGLETIREQIAGSADPVDPQTFVAFLGAELDELSRHGGYLSIVLHPAMVDWLGRDNLTALLNRVTTARERDGVWIAPCVEVAERVLADPERFHGRTVLDATGWAAT